MALSQSQFSEQMIAQLRLLKPTISAEAGTPERLLLEVVGQGLAENQIDLVGLQNALNIDTKYGSNLDNFVELFGFTRISASKAEGYVVFSRNTEAPYNIPIPQGTLLQSKTTNSTSGAVSQFVTSVPGVLEKGQTKTNPIPIVATTSGSNGNVPAESITIMVGSPILGITAVTNPTETSNGEEGENDNSLKTRFKNTVFRNLAGTESQYLALAISTAFSKKANVIGPVSTYQEYIEVPQKNDSEPYAYAVGGISYPGAPTKVVTKVNVSGSEVEIPSISNIANLGITTGESVVIYKEGFYPAVEVSGVTVSEVISGSNKFKISGTHTGLALTDVVCLIGSSKTGISGDWTTALSDIPYAKDIWRTRPVFITNGRLGSENYFYREGVDFELNSPPRFQGDTLRAFIAGVGLDPESDEGEKRPNITFTNVYEGNETLNTISKNQILLLEFSYTSTSSRNDINRNITNAVDVFVDGINNETATTLLQIPTNYGNYVFVNEPTKSTYYENYRRVGEPTTRPLISNLWIPLFQEPISSIPKSLTIEEDTYYLGTHYWLVKETADYAGTIRARDGIEFSTTIKGDKGTESELLGPEEGGIPKSYTGKLILEHLGDILEVENYLYNTNIKELQAALEASKQITTDVLAHESKIRYFKLDVTVIYAPTGNISEINNNIRNTLSSFFENQYFGSVIRMSDLLSEVKSVSGVENVRWTDDYPNAAQPVRVYETDIEGNALFEPSVERIYIKSGSQEEEIRLFINSDQKEGNLILTYDSSGTGASGEITLEYNLILKNGASYIKERLDAVLGVEFTVTKDVRPETNVINPIISFTITYPSTFYNKRLPRLTNPVPSNKETIENMEYLFNADFFLRDDELPSLPEKAQEGDTLPGLIIRPRAEGTFYK